MDKVQYKGNCFRIQHTIIKVLSIEPVTLSEVFAKTDPLYLWSLLCEITRNQFYNMGTPIFGVAFASCL